jgi:TPR repeat protein
MAETEMLWRLAASATEAGDFARAKSLYERGAALGDALCWVGLGYMFDVGQGVDADKHRAMRCYRAAWRSRDAAAANNIAVLYREMGDRRATFRWFKRAAEHGDDGAYLELAKCYRDGVGVRRSLDEALRCLSKVMTGTCASEADREEAQEMLEGFRPRSI